MIDSLYSSDVPELLQRHFDVLRLGSGLDVAVIRERGYRSVLGRVELEAAGFGKSQRRPPGMLLPVWSPEGGNTLSSYRPDVPRVNSRGRELKY